MKKITIYVSESDIQLLKTIGCIPYRNATISNYAEYQELQEKFGALVARQIRERKYSK